MFKVQENGDGSTSIFCNKTGKLICTIKSQQKTMGLGCRPVNVVEPSPKPRSCCYNLDIKSSEYSSDDEDKKFSSRRSISPVSVESKEDYTDECISPDEFTRCLNLIPKEKFNNSSLDELKSTFPLRHLSRTKKVRINEDLHDIKLPDDLPLTSCLGVKLLKLNPQRNFCNDQTILMKIKNYDSFCRFQLNTPSVCGNFPKLRCREKKEYPICTSLKILRHYPTHIYTFGRRQRLEKKITLKTGLDSRSRKLLLKCNKQLRVSIKRLTAQEIHNWLQKRSKIIKPISADRIRQSVSVYSDSEATVIDESSESDSSDCSYIDVLDSGSSTNSSSKFPVEKRIASFSGVLTDPVICLSPLKNSVQCRILDKNRTCYVKLGNILKQVRKAFDGYYIDETIRIPFLSEYLNSLNPKFLTSNFISDNHFSSPRYDHAYHRPISQECVQTDKLLHSSCLNHKIGKLKNFTLSNLKVKINKSNMPNNLNIPGTAKNPPLIDLTDSPEKTTTHKLIYVTSYIFCCHACDFKNVYKKKQELDFFMADHMKGFHNVLNPDSFLHSSYDPARLIFNVEAFPGYKK